MIGGGSAEVINAAGEAFSDVGVGTFKVVGTAGKVVSSAADATASAANTGKILVDVTGKTVVGITSNTGAAATAAVGTVKQTLLAVEDLSERFRNNTETSKKLAQKENETALVEKQNAQKADMANSDANTQIKLQQIEADRQTKIQKINFDLVLKQKETEEQQKLLLSKLTTEQTQAYLETEENKKKIKEANYYGFTKNNPGSRDTGFKKSNMPFSKWCYSYIPNTFVKSDNTGLIEIYFPDQDQEQEQVQQPKVTRSYEISALNRITKEPITITFRIVQKKNWIGQPYRGEVPVIKYMDKENNNVEFEGTIDYHKIWFVCPITSTGGRRLRTNKRRTNKRRTNKRRTNRRRPNKRRTNKRTTNKRRTNRRR